MAYPFVGLIALLGAAVLLAFAMLIGSFLVFAHHGTSPDGHDRAAEREARWYPLR
jgi:hypothetical protein